MSESELRPFDTARFAALREARRVQLGDPLIWRAETLSTNDDALSAARTGAAAGAVFGAEYQRQGRGRRGHPWLSKPRENLLFSVLLRPEAALESAFASTLAVGVAVRDALAARISRPVKLKWPNDVWVDGGKVAGILLESQARRSRLLALVVGIGINVLACEFPAGLRTPGSSLKLLGSADLEREALLLDVLANLEQRAAQYFEHGIQSFSAELAQHDALFDRKIAIDGQVGTARGIDAAGRLLLCKTDGQTLAVMAGSVELL